MNKYTSNLDNIKRLEIIKNNLLNEFHNYMKKNGGELSLQMGNIPEVMQWGTTGKLIFCYLINNKLHSIDMDKKLIKLKNTLIDLIENKGYKNLEEKIYKNLMDFNYIINSNLLYRCFYNDVLYMRAETVIDFFMDLYFTGKIKESEGKGFIPAIINYINTYLKNKHYMTVEEERKNIDFIMQKFNKGCPLQEQREKYKNLVEAEQNPKLKNILKCYSIVK